MGRLSTVCVYCGSRFGTSDEFRSDAFKLGKSLAHNKIDVVYGGGMVGIMGAVADAAKANGGRVIGIIPKSLEDREVGNRKIDELFIVDSMHERKALMAEKTDAFVVLPGGLGTLDEFFEIVTWRQLGFHNKPVIVVNTENYWAPLKNLIQSVVDHGFADTADQGLMHFVETVEEAMELLLTLPESVREMETSKL